MMAFFTIPELNIDTDIYWQIAAFARSFGAVLFAMGFLIWAVARAFSSLSIEYHRGIFFFSAT